MIDYEKLAEPFDPFAIEWRVQTAGITDAGKQWAMVVPYVTNRAIQDRLDTVCGVAGWKNEFVYPTEKSVLCGLSIFVNDSWLTKWDGADETSIEATKGGLSGAMKRAAVQWGIGRYLYELSEAWVNFVTDQPKDDTDFIKATIKLQGKQKRIWFKRPKLPLFALPKEDK